MLIKGQLVSNNLDETLLTLSQLKSSFPNYHSTPPQDIRLNVSLDLYNSGLEFGRQNQHAKAFQQFENALLKNKISKSINPQFELEINRSMGY